MSDNLRELVKELLGCSSVLLALTIGLALTFSACGKPDDIGSMSTPDDIGSTSTPDDIGPTSTPTTVIFSKAHSPSHYGAGSPTVSERIFKSDVIVRASLQSAAAGKLRFRTIEYLKGTGPTEFVVRASTVGRDTRWDGREAILFLSRSATAGASGGSGSTAGEFRFTDAYHFEHQGSDTNYAISTQNPVWIPAVDTPEAVGESGENGGSDFITDAEAVTGGSPSPTISLADLRAKIAWMEGGAGIVGYDDCVEASVNYERWYRDWEAYHGRLYTPEQYESQVASGASAGTVVHEYGLSQDAEYERLWITGQNSASFEARNVDDDALAYNGYTSTIMTTRPLPSGTYRFADHSQAYYFIPCSFVPENHQLKWVVTVTAPTGTTHEAFFDPLTLTAGGVGANATEGALKPAAFTVGSQNVELESLAWSGGSAVLTLDTHVSLSGRALDVIALDGTGAVTLATADATVDQANATWTWSVAAAPWKNGDKLMLRLRDATAAAPPTPEPTPTPTPTATPTPTPTPAPAVECMLGSGVQTLPWAVSHTALTECTIGYANARRIYYFRADQSGYITVANTTPQGDAYLRLKEAAGFGQNRANLTARIPVGQSAGANVTAGQWYALMLLGTADGQTITGSVSGSNGLTSIR